MGVMAKPCRWFCYPFTIDSGFCRSKSDSFRGSVNYLRRPVRIMSKSNSAKRQASPVPVSCISDSPSDWRDWLVPAADLSQRQQSALPAVALSPSLVQAAQTTGVGKTTLSRWMNNPAFRAEVNRIRQESAALACQELQGMMLRAVGVINQALDHPDPVISLRAARYTLSFATTSSQIQRISSELNELRNSLDSNNQESHGE